MALQQPVSTSLSTLVSPSASLSSSKSQMHLSVQALEAHEQQQRTAASQSSQTLTNGLRSNERQSGHRFWQARSASSSSEQDDGQHSGSALTDRSFFDHDVETIEDLPAEQFNVVADAQGICCSSADTGVCLIEGPASAMQQQQQLQNCTQALHSQPAIAAAAAAAVPPFVQQQQRAKLQQQEALQLQQQQCFAVLANVPAVASAAATSPALITAARFFAALSSSGALRCSSTSGTCDEYSTAQQQQQQQCQDQQCSSYGVRLYEVGEAFGRSATHSTAVRNDVAIGESPSDRCIMAAGKGSLLANCYYSKV
jgi:hypothetical protein